MSGAVLGLDDDRVSAGGTIGWLRPLLIGAGLASACTETETEAEPPAPADAVVEPADGVEDAEIVAVDPEAVPEAGTRLLDPGKGEPLELRYAPADGATKRLVVTVRVNTRQGEKRAPLSPRARFELDTTTTRTADGTITRSFEIVKASVVPERRVADEAEGTLAAAIEVLAGRTGKVQIDALGEVKGYAFEAPESFEPRRVTVGAGQKTAMRRHLVPLPEQAVGRRGSWEVTRRADLHGLELWEVGTYTFEQHDGEQIAVSGALKYPNAEVAGQPVGFARLTVTSFEGKGSWTVRFDRSTAEPVESHATFEATFAGATADGQEAPGRFGVDVTVEEDYLAMADPRVRLEGIFAQGGLIVGSVPPNTKVWLDKKRIKVSEAGDFLLGFHVDAPRRALFSFALPGEAPERHVVHIEPRSFEPEAIDGLPDELVNLESGTRKELRKSNKQIEKVRSKVTDATYFAKGFSWPVRGRVTSTYGRQRILNGENKGIHWGIDIAAPKGTKVKAPAGGVVVFAEEDVPLSGNLLIIDHGHGLTSSFLHLKRFRVKVGDEVEKGQLIAEVGSTGRSTGPHLDWRMNLGDTRIDPELLLIGKR